MGPNGRGCYWLLIEPGCGKTSVTAKLLAQIRLKHSVRNEISTPSAWRMTRSACADYARIKRWDGYIQRRAAAALARLAQRAHWVDTDRHGRELWRSPRADRHLRWVVDPRQLYSYPSAAARVLWVGYSKPPERLWAPMTGDGE